MVPEVKTSDRSSADTNDAPNDVLFVVVVCLVAETALFLGGEKRFDGDDANEPYLVRAKLVVPKPCAIQGALLENPNSTTTTAETVNRIVCRMLRVRTMINFWCETKLPASLALH